MKLNNSSVPDLQPVVAARTYEARERSPKHFVALRNEQYITAMHSAAHVGKLDVGGVSAQFGVPIQFVAEFAAMPRDQIREFAACCPLLIGMKLPLDALRKTIDRMRTSPPALAVTVNADKNQVALTSLRINQIIYEYLLTIASAVDRASSPTHGYRQCSIVLNCPQATAELIHQTGWDVLQSISKLGTELVGWRPCEIKFRNHLDQFKHQQNCSDTRIAMLIDSARRHRELP